MQNGAARRLRGKEQGEEDERREEKAMVGEIREKISCLFHPTARITWRTTLRLEMRIGRLRSFCELMKCSQAECLLRSSSCVDRWEARQEIIECLEGFGSVGAKLASRSRCPNLDWYDVMRFDPSQDSTVEDLDYLFDSSFLFEHERLSFQQVATPNSSAETASMCSEDSE
eukprot:749666-Hanusia_phi.AAC.7